MGTDIHGWVEIRNPYLDDAFDEIDWYTVIDAGALFDRNYAMFGSLFGVRNNSGFLPLAEGRGLPLDVSEDIQQHDQSEPILFHSASWISLQELDEVDWRERSQEDTTRWEVLGYSGQLVVELMRTLGKQYRHDCIRLVAWFDN